MRFLMFVFLVSTMTALAFAGTDEEIKALEDAREEALYQWRTSHRMSKLPNDEYVQFYTETWKKFGEEEQKVHQTACAANPASCLSEADKNLKLSQVRIATGLIAAKNNWARQGKSEEEQKTSEDHFQNCVKENKDCDKLPEGERTIASNTRTGTDTPVIPEVKPEEETKPEEPKNEEEEVVVTPPIENTDDVAVTPPNNNNDVVVTPPIDPIDEENDDEKSPRNYKAETCKWVTDIPRKIVNGPSCGKTRSRICTGYVVCEQKEGGGKFIRMSTCRSDYCGGTDADAVKCTMDQAYYSQKPASEEKMFMSGKLKKILSGSSEQ